MAATTAHAVGTVSRRKGKGQFRIVDVWESEQNWQSFRDGRLAAAVQPLIESGEGAPPSVEDSYELHDVIKP